MSANKRPLHATTSAAATGLGRELAGRASVSEVWMPDSLPWHPDHAPSVWSPPLPALVALIVELKRAGHLEAIKEQWVALCGDASLKTPPLHAIERWLLMSKWEENAAGLSSEPLFPGPAECVIADSALAGDLTRVGMDHRTAQRLVKTIRQLSAESAQNISSLTAALTLLHADAARQLPEILELSSDSACGPCERSACKHE